MARTFKDRTDHERLYLFTARKWIKANQKGHVEHAARWNSAMSRVAQYAAEHDASSPRSPHEKE